MFIALGDVDCGSGKDLVGWRSREDIVKSLMNFTGKKLRISYANNLINLLKTKLKDAGYDSELIQTHREKGARLAVKRRCAREQLKAFFDIWLQENQNSQKKLLSAV